VSGPSGISGRPEIPGLDFDDLSRNVISFVIGLRPEIAPAMRLAIFFHLSSDNSSPWREEGQLFLRALAPTGQGQTGCLGRDN
jgi:hypothetical protein